MLKLSIPSRLFYIGLWNFADDNGVLEADPVALKAKIYPADDLNIQNLINEIVQSNKMFAYEIKGKKYLLIKALKNHQVIDRPRISNLPLPTRNQLKSIDFIEISVGKGKEGKGKEGKGTQKEADSSEDASPIVLTYPTVGKGGIEWHLREAKLKEYQDSYPNLDALSICRKARQWCIDNPGKRKTVGGMAAFLTRWLNKETDSPKGDGYGAKTNSTGAPKAAPGKYERRGDPGGPAEAGRASGTGKAEVGGNAV